MQFWSSLQSTLAAFGGIVAVAVLIVSATYGLFKMFAGTWLDSRFADRREALKHEQQKELEALKVQIARLTDRATKLNQREFDVIPEAWARLCDAYEATRSLVASLQTVPDIDNMTSEHQNEFISGCKLEEWQKKELGSAESKTDYYEKMIFWHNLAETREYSGELYMYVRKNSILMPKDIRIQFRQLGQIIHNTLIEHEVNHRNKFIQIITEERKKFIKEGEAIMTNLEKAIEQRLSTLTQGESL